MRSSAGVTGGYNTPVTDGSGLVGSVDKATPLLAVLEAGVGVGVDPIVSFIPMKLVTNRICINGMRAPPWTRV